MACALGQPALTCLAASLLAFAGTGCGTPRGNDSPDAFETFDARMIPFDAGPASDAGAATDALGAPDGSASGDAGCAATTISGVLTNVPGVTYADLGDGTLRLVSSTFIDDSGGLGWVGELRNTTSSSILCPFLRIDLSGSLSDVSVD